MLLALAAVTVADDRTRTPVFKAAIELVSVGVSVTDANARFVTQLEESDFTVFEDGVRQRLALFRREQVPLSVVVMIDSSASMDERLPAAQEAAIRLVRRLRPRDSAQVISFADHTLLLQDFTSDQTTLETAIRGIRAEGQTALREALYEALKRISRLRATDEERRWAVVLLSDGEDTSSLVTEEDLLELVGRTDVTIHTIGLPPRHVEREARLSLSRARHFLAALARETGGEEYFPRSVSDLDAVYDRIADSLRSQYVLGYVPANGHGEGGWRRILVRLPARPDLAPHHRRGYLASSRYASRP